MGVMTEIAGKSIAAPLDLGIAILALAILYVLFRDYKVDKLRDEIFSLRDNLFDFGRENDLLSHAGYQRLRLIMNSMLRFSHKLTFVRFVMVGLLLRGTKLEPNPYAEWMKSLNSLQPDKAQRLKEFHSEMWLLVVCHVYETSIAMRAIGACFSAQRFIRKINSSTISIFMKRMPGRDLIEAQAFWFRR